MKNNLRVYFKGRIGMSLFSELIMWMIILYFKSSIAIYIVWISHNKSNIEFAYLLDPYMESLPKFHRNRMKEFLVPFIITRLMLFIMFLIISFAIIPVFNTNVKVTTFNQNVVIVIGALYFTSIITYISMTYRVHNIKNGFYNYLIMTGIIIGNSDVAIYSKVGIRAIPDPNVDYVAILGLYAVTMILTLVLTRVNIYVAEKRIINDMKLAEKWLLERN